MKKHVNLFVAAIAVLSVAVLSGCGSLSVKSVEKDPNVVVADSIKQTTDGILGNAKKLKDIPNPDGGGTVSMDLSSNMFSLGTKLSFDDDVNSSYSISVSALGKTLDADIFREGSTIAVSSSEVLGDGTFGLDLSSAKDDIKGSVIMDLLGVEYDSLPKEQRAMIESTIDDFDEMFNIPVSENIEDSKRLVEDLKEATSDGFDKATVTIEEDEKTFDGKSKKLISVNYSFSNDRLVDLANGYTEVLKDFAKNSKYMSIYDSPLFAYQGINVVNSLEEFARALEEEIRYDNARADITFLINKKTKDIVSVECVIFFDESYSMEIILDIGLTPKSSEEYSLKITEKYNGEKEEVLKAVWEKSESKKKIGGTLKITIDGDTLTCKVNYDPSTSEYSIKLSASTDPDEKIGIDGTFEFGKDFYTFTVDKISGLDPSMTSGVANIEFSLKYERDTDIAPMPDFKNVLKLTEDELMHIGEKSYEFFGGFSGLF